MSVQPCRSSVTISTQSTSISHQRHPDSLFLPFFLDIPNCFFVFFFKSLSRDSSSNILRLHHHHLNLLFPRLHVISRENGNRREMPRFSVKFITTTLAAIIASHTTISLPLALPGSSKIQQLEYRLFLFLVWLLNLVIELSLKETNN